MYSYTTKIKYVLNIYLWPNNFFRMLGNHLLLDNNLIHLYGLSVNIKNNQVPKRPKRQSDIPIYV